MKIAGLFAGIGGFERGLSLEGHSTELLCDVLPHSEAVLKEHFVDVPYEADVRQLASLPESVDLVTAGFPCQDLSQAGRTAGLKGLQSGLINEVFRLLRHRRIGTVVVENVPFMLQLSKGEAMRAIVDEFEQLGYKWAYRTVDTFSFGLPQRRERVIFVASTVLDPTTVLFADDNPLLRPATAIGELAHGFYWTEGLTGLGWAVDSIPTLKNGSTIGIPSPPAIFMPDGRIVKPSIEDAEALQGFPRGWTESAQAVAKPSARWSLVGSAVSVPVAQWIGRRLSNPGDCCDFVRGEFPLAGRCPKSACFDGKRRWTVSMSPDPVGIRPMPLTEFLEGPLEALSLRATLGFLSRTRRARLRFESAFIQALETHILGLGGDLPATTEVTDT